MPQMSHAYAVGRVRALERGLLSQAALQRLQNAQSPDEVARLLTELGWGECKTQRDVERLAEHIGILRAHPGAGLARNGHAPRRTDTRHQNRQRSAQQTQNLTKFHNRFLLMML